MKKIFICFISINFLLAQNVGDYKIIPLYQDYDNEGDPKYRVDTIYFKNGDVMSGDITNFGEVLNYTRSEIVSNNALDKVTITIGAAYSGERLVQEIRNYPLDEIQKIELRVTPPKKISGPSPEMSKKELIIGFVVLGTIFLIIYNNLELFGLLPEVEADEVDY